MFDQRARDRRRAATGENRHRMQQRQARQWGMSFTLYLKIRRIKHEIKEQRQIARDIIAYHRAELRAKINDVAPGEARDIKNAKARDAYRRNPEAWYRAAYKRRALSKQAQIGKYLSRRQVFDRDNWRCRICKKQVRDDVPRDHPAKAVRAHIVALAAGGSESADNLCCLCNHCNRRDNVNKLPIQTSIADGEPAFFCGDAA